MIHLSFFQSALLLSAAFIAGYLLCNYLRDNIAKSTKSVIAER